MQRALRQPEARMDQSWRQLVWASRPQDELLQLAEHSVLRAAQLSAPMLPAARVQVVLLEQVSQPGRGEQPRERQASLPLEAVVLPQEEQLQQEREPRLQRGGAGEQPKAASCALLWRLLPSPPFPLRRFAPRRPQPRPYPGNVCAPLQRLRHRSNSSAFSFL
jgi:hypothetical protein